jgi:hypothetical protein
MLEKVRRRLEQLEAQMGTDDDGPVTQIRIMYVEGVDGRPGKVTLGEVIHVRCGRAAKKNGGDRK